MEFRGIITFMGQIETVGEKKITKQEIVVEKSEDTEHGEKITGVSVNIWDKKVEDIKTQGIGVGDDVSVKFNTKVTKWEKDGKVRHFNNLNAWKIEKVNASSGKALKSMEDVADDLPF